MNSIVSIEKVVKVYRVGSEDFTALHEISLEIEAGAFMSFVGPSGSGKTTLLNLIGGLDQPTSGSIFFKNVKLGELNRTALAEYRRKNLGFVFQTYNLLPVYSVYENILFPLLLDGNKESAVRQLVMDMVASVGLSDQIKKRPSQLSGGQCQRVAIARALVKKPALILADEPTANLDAENSYQILELMRELNKQFKAAFVFSTHDEKVTKYVTREVGLEDGRVCWDKRRNGFGSLE
ncbi:MAG: ABC transporter ATP-binding protein [Nitrospinae bacterium]|nr:ABC transporter ATP-binding protein [Nitrospinota bacterium]